MIISVRTNVVKTNSRTNTCRLRVTRINSSCRLGIKFNPLHPHYQLIETHRIYLGAWVIIFFSTYSSWTNYSNYIVSRTRIKMVIPVFYRPVKNAGRFRFCFCFIGCSIDFPTAAYKICILLIMTKRHYGDRRGLVTKIRTHNGVNFLFIFLYPFCCSRDSKFHDVCVFSFPLCFVIHVMSLL